MALTKGQAEKTIKLFALAFTAADNEQDRRILISEFEDVFGRSIKDWEVSCREELKNSENSTIAEEFDDIMIKKKNKSLDGGYKIRELRESDLEDIIKMLNQTFSLALSVYEKDKFEKFITGGLSFVICNGDEVLGVVLGYAIPDLNMGTVYMDTLAVGSTVRGMGLGKQLFRHFTKAASAKDIHVVRLQTDPNIEAYKIYRHWGFNESELVHMKKFFI